MKSLTTMVENHAIILPLSAIYPLLPNAFLLGITRCASRDVYVNMLPTLLEKVANSLSSILGYQCELTVPQNVERFLTRVPDIPGITWHTMTHTIIKFNSAEERTHFQLTYLT
jgi:hypothetical protein